MEMAKKEGWTKNAKYQSIPEQMLRYRSAAFLIRLYCPEVMIGVPAQVELELEARDVTPTGGADVVEANEEAPIEAKAEPVEDTAKAKTATDAAEAKAREQAKPNAAAAQAEEEAKAAAATQNAKTDTPAPDRERFENLYEMIAAEAQNGASAQEIEETYGPFIEQIKAHSPHLKERPAGVDEGGVISMDTMNISEPTVAELATTPSPAFCVFDTETTGLFKFKLPADDPSQPRLASAALIVADQNGKEI